MSWEWKFQCEAESSYDGDTFKLCIDLGFALRHYAAIRLDGVDTPELRGGTLLTKAAAKLARDEAWNFVEAANELIFYSKVWKGKYGRPVGDLICDGKPLSQYLIDERLGVPYDGGSRKAIQAIHVKNAEWLRDNGRLKIYGF